MSIDRVPQHLAAAPWRYSPPAVVLHWLLALLIVFMVALGWWMMSIERTPQGPWYFDLHRSIGLVVAALVALRLLWRAGHRVAPLPAAVPPWQVRLSAATQRLLYACMVALPVTGFVGSWYSRAGIRFFGWQLPQLPRNRQLSHLLFETHSVIVWVLVVLVALHVAAALKHLLVDRDAVFQRMWFKP